MDTPLPPLPSIPPPSYATPPEPVRASSSLPPSHGFPPAAAPPPPPPPVQPTIMYSSPPPPRRSNGCLWAVVVLLILFLAGSLFFNAAMTLGVTAMGDFSSLDGNPAPRHKFNESLEEPGKADSKDRIVRIDLEGIIMSGGGAEGLFSQGMPMVDKIKRSLEQAVKDDKVKAIVLRVNSPGGEVTASDIMYAAVKAAAKVKPVVVYMDSIAASGGYYISCGATQIVATETTLTASIGVIMESLSYHGLFDKVGLGMNTFTSGPLKDTLNGARPMRPEERDYIQGLVNGMYDRFLTVVAEGRHLDKEALRKGIADGRVVSGADALKAKLVDKIGYVEDAYKLARELGKAPDAMVVKYSRSSGWLDLFSAEAESRGKVELQLPGPAMLPKLLPGQMYYLPETFAH